MAGARAATSLSMTIGVAAATLLVMGGILAGPAILDCARDGSKFGACLRDKIADSGLIAPEGETIEKQIVTSEAPSLEPAPPIVAEIPAPAGWLEAKANEYQPGSSAPAVLSATPGDLFAAGDMSRETQPGIKVALAEPAGTMAVSGVAAPPLDAAIAAIARTPGELSANSHARRPAAPIEVALALPPGKLSVAGSKQTSPAVAPLVLAPGGGVIAKGGAPAEPGIASLEIALTGPAGELTASMAALDVAPATALLTLLPLAEIGASPDPDATVEVSLPPDPRGPGLTLATGSPGPAPGASAAVSLQASTPVAIDPPVPEAPAPVIEFNPAFPNVLVLPAPSTGEDSSFRALQLN